MSSNSGATDSISSEAAVAMAAVMGLRQQHLNAAVANQHHNESDLTNFNLRSGKISCLDNEENKIIKVLYLQALGKTI